MAVPYPSTIKLAHLPTPIHRLNRLTEMFGGPEIYIKRDDLTGNALSGNKVRKLEYVISDAVKNDADMLITCGGIQSNHARATAVAASSLGIGSYLVLRGEISTPLDGNLLLDRLVGSRIKTITPEDYSERRDAIMQDVADEMRLEGKTPYIIPEGASNALGSFGYIAAAEEIGEQLSHASLDIDALVCAVGSGGTHAGLLTGTKLFQQEYPVAGINVCDDADYFVNRIWHLVEDLEKQYNINAGVTRSDIQIVDGFVGRGYALNRQEEIDLIKEVAMAEGIILDPVYTAKAMLGLKTLIRKGVYTRGQKVLFLHSGGIFGLFPKRELFY